MVSLLGSAAVLIILWVLRSAWLKGSMGEVRVSRALRAGLNEAEYRVLNGLILPTPDGTTQVDHIVVSRFGIFVVETKNMGGWIFGDADQSLWTQVFYGHKTRFQNPLRQNYKHIKAVGDALQIPARHIHGVVVFVGSGEPRTAMPGSVLWGVGDLVKHIQSMRALVFRDEDVEVLVEGLSNKAVRPSFFTRRTHVKHVKSLARRKADGVSCPRCGNQLVERTNKATGEHFLGCSRYPDCTGTRRMAAPSVQRRF